MAKEQSAPISTEPAEAPPQGGSAPAQGAWGQVGSPPPDTAGEVPPPAPGAQAIPSAPETQAPEGSAPAPASPGGSLLGPGAGLGEVVPSPEARSSGFVPESEARGAEALLPAEGSLKEVLSQSEVERLLTQVQAQETSAPVLKPGGQKTRLKSEDIQPCDFRQPAFLTSSELRKIRLRHEEFIRSLAAHLSIYLRLEVVIHLSKLQTLSFQRYAEGLPNPTHVTLFKVEPLKGVCLLDMSPRLGLTLVDRLLGGPAHSVGVNGELSEIEAALLDQVAQIILNEWCQLWQKIETARPVLLGHENSGRFLASSPHDSVMLILSMEVRLGDCVEQMQLALPFLTIEPLVRHAGAATGSETGPAANQRGQPQWNPWFDEVPVQLHTQWQGLELTARQLSRLKCGDVLDLEANCFDRVEVRLEQLPKFYGRLGTTGDHWAVELTERVKS